MSTQEALDNITDRGKFELLVTSILRKNPDYAAIIHSGINAQGETIKSPVDGFCLVPGSAPGLRFGGAFSLEYNMGQALEGPVDVYPDQGTSKPARRLYLDSSE